MRTLTLEHKIKKYKDNNFSDELDNVVVEKSIDIFINDNFYITVICLPKNLSEFVVGFLYFEDFIKSYDEIIDISIDEEKNIIKIKLNKKVEIHRDKKKVLTTGCGKSYTEIDINNPVNCKRINTSFKLNADKVIELMKEFNTKSELFLETGGVHACAIVNENGFVTFMEDIGRHNAFDKVIGYCLINNISFAKMVLLTSGRISGEIIAKTIKSKLPIIISRSAPTSHGLKLAEKFFATLIGFARGNRFNIYTYPERIV
ncbi:formate dehydrogenase accessory sulfurtransferase FdhD [bacterium]